MCAAATRTHVVGRAAADYAQSQAELICGSLVDVEARAQHFMREYNGLCEMHEVRLEDLNTAPSVEAFLRKVRGARSERRAQHVWSPRS